MSSLIIQILSPAETGCSYFTAGIRLSHLPFAIGHGNGVDKPARMPERPPNETADHFYFVSHAVLSHPSFPDVPQNTLTRRAVPNWSRHTGRAILRACQRRNLLELGFMPLFLVTMRRTNRLLKRMAIFRGRFQERQGAAGSADSRSKFWLPIPHQAFRVPRPHQPCKIWRMRSFRRILFVADHGRSFALNPVLVRDGRKTCKEP